MHANRESCSIEYMSKRRPLSPVELNVIAPVESDMGLRLWPDLDRGNAFWTVEHKWTLWRFPRRSWSGYWNYGNFPFNAGNFRLGHAEATVHLKWVPGSQQNASERRLLRGGSSEMQREIPRRSLSNES